ncbi:MAG TPA: hypothetical protein ENJ82_06240 [Bacteroidetes bacterium]|nr:hypothetical protein [Bacteroidota bacterium]
MKILRIKGRVLIADQHPNYLDETEKNSDEITRTIFIIQNKYALLSLRNQLFLRVRENSKIRQEGQLHDLAEVMKAPLLQNIQQALSFDACLNFHFSHALFHQTKWELKQALYHHEQIYLKWKSNPQFQKYRATDYRNSLNNYLGLCNAEHQFEHFAEALIALEKPPFQSKDEEAEARQNGLFVRLQHWITKCKWEDAIKVEDTFQKEQTLIGKKLTTSRRMAFSMSFSWLCLIVGDLEGAIKWNEDLLALGTQAVRIDLRRYALLFALIIHFELGNVDQLDNRYRAALRAYKKDELELQYEKMVLKFLLKLQKVPVGEMLQSLLLELRGNLSGLLNLPEERNALGFEFTMQWVASKVEKCSLKCILEKHI